VPWTHAWCGCGCRGRACACGSWCMCSAAWRCMAPHGAAGRTCLHADWEAVTHAVSGPSSPVLPCRRGIRQSLQPIQVDLAIALALISRRCHAPGVPCHLLQEASCAASAAVAVSRSDENSTARAEEPSAISLSLTQSLPTTLAHPSPTPNIPVHQSCMRPDLA
jgi:hypothetical protein